MLSEHLVWCVCVCPIIAEVHNSNTTCYGGLTLWKSFILWLNFVAKMSWKLVQCRTKKLFCRYLPLGWLFTVSMWLNFKMYEIQGVFVSAGTRYSMLNGKKFIYSILTVHAVTSPSERLRNLFFAQPFSAKISTSYVFFLARFYGILLPKHWLPRNFTLTCHVTFGNNWCFYY